jgi:hypothetical protein
LDKKLDLFLKDPTHPSLRTKKMQGTATIWEFSVTIHYRVTFEPKGDGLWLRRVGTHEVFRNP